MFGEVIVEIKTLKEAVNRLTTHMSLLTTEVEALRKELKECKVEERKRF